MKRPSSLPTSHCLARHQPFRHLWRYPLVSFSIELALILSGAWLYWRAANRVVKTEGTGGLAATIAASLIAIFGVLILRLDFTGT